MFANPFNPETRPRHHLESGRISGPARKYGAKSGFNQPCRVEAVEPAQAGVWMWQGGGQRPQVGFGGQGLGGTSELGGSDWGAGRGGGVRAKGWVCRCTAC